MNVGIISVNGISSSTKEKIPPTFPMLPLYIVANIIPETGAHTTSENSPINGIEKDIMPMASHIIPSIRFRYLWDSLVCIFK